jgi:hypothetical protein
MQLYYMCMEDAIKNYPLRTDGSAVLREFAIDEDLPTWPSSLIQFWNTIKHKGRSNLETWKQQGNCCLNAEEKQNMINDLQVRVYIGFMIHEVAKQTKTFCNNHVNKQWPETLQSGECPSALLQAIRHNYYMTVEAKEKAVNVAKQWKTARKRQKIETTDKQFSQKLNETWKTYKFSLTYFPDEWLTWVLYGPPAGLDRPEFKDMSMLHLRQVKSLPRELTENEMVEHIEKQSKLIRRKNRKQSAVDDDASDNDDQQSNVASLIKGNTHTVIRELKLPAPTAVTCLDMAINAKMAIIDLIRGRNVNDSRIEVLNEEIYDLLNKKAEEAMREYERAVLKAT